MARYTNRTCVHCGIRKPQPEMYQSEVYSEVGKSKAGVSTSTFVGFFLGNKKSENAVDRWLFNTNQRTYKRKRNVWLCYDCLPSSHKRGTISNALMFIFKAIYYVAAFFIVALIISVLGQV